MRGFSGIVVFSLLSMAVQAIGQEQIFEDSFELCLHPDTIEWDGGGDGSKWGDPLNWEGDVVPGDGARALILKSNSIVVFDVSAVDTTLDCFGSTAAVEISNRKLTINGPASFAAGLKISGGELVVNGRGSVRDQLNQSGGVLSGVGFLRVQGLFDWTDGRQLGTGVTTIDGATSISFGGAHDLLERTINLSGVTTWSGGNIRAGLGAIINIDADFDITGDGDITLISGGTTTLNINAPLTKSAGAGLSSLSANFNNNSTITVATGQLSLGLDGSNGVSSGDFSVANLSTMTILGEHSLSGMFAGDGLFIFAGTSANVSTVTGTSSFNSALEIKSGRLVFNNAQAFPDSVSLTGSFADIELQATTTIANDVMISGGEFIASNSVDIGGMLSHSGGEILGSGTITVTGNYLWTAGRQSAVGVTTIGGTTSIAGVTHDLLQRTLNLNGSTIWSGGDIRAGLDAIINIGAAFDITGDGDINFIFGGTTTLNINAPLTKSAGAGLSSINADVVNASSISVTSGQIGFARTYQQSSTGTLEVNISSLASFDVFAVTQAATLDGTLQVNLLGGYTPNSADSFEILTGSPVAGTFSTVNVNPAGNFNVNYNANDVTLVTP